MLSVAQGDRGFKCTLLRDSIQKGKDISLPSVVCYLYSRFQDGKVTCAGKEAIVHDDVRTPGKCKRSPFESVIPSDKLQTKRKIYSSKKLFPGMKKSYAKRLGCRDMSGGSKNRTSFTASHYLTISLSPHPPCLNSSAIHNYFRKSKPGEKKGAIFVEALEHRQRYGSLEV